MLIKRKTFISFILREQEMRLKLLREGLEKKINNHKKPFSVKLFECVIYDIYYLNQFYSFRYFSLFYLG